MRLRVTLCLALAALATPTLAQNAATSAQPAEKPVTTATKAGSAKRRMGGPPKGAYIGMDG